MLVESYERLREQVTRTVSVELSVARQIFCQRGLAAWLTDICLATAPARPVSRPPETSPPMLPADANIALVGVVASMVSQLFATGGCS